MHLRASAFIFQRMHKLNTINTIKYIQITTRFDVLIFLEGEGNLIVNLNPNKCFFFFNLPHLIQYRRIKSLSIVIRFMF